MTPSAKVAPNAGSAPWFVTVNSIFSSSPPITSRLLVSRVTDKFASVRSVGVGVGVGVAGGVGVGVGVGVAVGKGVGVGGAVGTGVGVG